MNKKLSVLLACAVIMLSGCGTVPPEETKATEQTTAETTAETTATTTQPETTEAVTTTENPNKELTLNEIGIENLPGKDLKFFYGDNSFVTGYIDAENANILSDKSLELTKGYHFNVRPSTNIFFTEEDDIDNIPTAPFSNYGEFESAYEIEWQHPVVNYMMISKEKDYIKSVELSYKIKNEFQVNAFIKKVGNNAEIVIDPAYMYNIPLFSDKPDLQNFIINNTKITADTISVNCTYGKDAEQVSSEEYAYATIYLSDFVCRYDTEIGYSNTAVISNAEILTMNTDDIINSPVIFTGEDKDPEMMEVYNAIHKELDTLLTDATYGIELIDMDFDGKPEVLVSKIEEEYRKEIGFGTPVDVDIYRVKNEELKYIDTLYNKSYISDMPANTFGLKEIDGKKYWFGVSRKNRDGKPTGENETDYLYYLEGDELKYREAFCSVLVGETVNEEGWVEQEFDYYFMGEKIVPEIEYDYEPYDFEQEYGKTWPYYSWNGINATFGMWELAGFIRADFCEDIKEVHSLYSDWLVNNTMGYSVERTDISKRTASYKLAYAIDEYYLSEFDEATGDFHYWFLGAYAKPVIYLYPEEETEVSVEVEFAEGGEFTCTYPEYGEGWKVTAMPDGTLYDEDGNEYYCLYWEGDGKADFDMSKGFCVRGEDTAEFLREKLMHIGLTAREANEFIIYWLPIMEDNKYNVITFHIDDYIKSVPMTITPSPDTVIRVFMTFTPSEEYVAISQQELPSYERNGFTVVEWGGGECEAVN